MPVDVAKLQMVRVQLDARRLAEIARERRLPPLSADTGYLVHCLLVGLFGDAAPLPFSIVRADGNIVEVLGYAREETGELERHARERATPKDVAACRWETLSSKVMPDSWRSGQTYEFEVRVCPVLRKSSAGEKHRKGAEVDVFLDRCWKAGPGVAVSREHVYGEWLGHQLARDGAAKVATCPEIIGAPAVEAGACVRLVRFKLERLLRRTHGEERKTALCDRPDATLVGQLEVGRPEAFAATLARGVGRHRAFGFGMLLLRPGRH